MNLLFKTSSAIGWVAKVNAAFCKVKPLTTLTLIFFTSTLRFSQVLATFLPLKVILLAGSEGIPSYFQFLIQPEMKSHWILGLALLSVGIYLLNILLGKWIKRLSEAGSIDVLQGANEVAVSSRQQDEASSYFAKFGSIVADTFVVIVAISLLAIIDYYLVLVLVVAFLVQYGVAWAAYDFGSPFETKGLRKLIVSNLSVYVGACSSINFLLSFFVLLVPFLIGSGGNLLFSILAILLLRQTFNALSSVINATVGLWKKKFQVDPMVFRHKKLLKPEHDSKKTLRSLFGKVERERVATEYLVLGSDFESAEKIDITSQWQDSSLSKVSTLIITIQAMYADSREKVKYYQHQIIPKSMLPIFEHEDFLFDYVSKESLHAPEIHAMFMEGDFWCRIYDYGVAQSFPADIWRNQAILVLLNCWGKAPPKSLINSYQTAHPTLPERLSMDFVKRVSVAIDTDADKKIFEDFLERHQSIIEYLMKVPLFIYNPDLSRMNVIRTENSYMIMSWGRWQLEPIGVGMPPSVDMDFLAENLRGLVERRSIKSERKALSSLMLSSQCHQLEKTIGGEKYKAAFPLMRSILEIVLLDTDTTSLFEKSG